MADTQNYCKQKERTAALSLSYWLSNNDVNAPRAYHDSLLEISYHILLDSVVVNLGSRDVSGPVTLHSTLIYKKIQPQTTDTNVEVTCTHMKLSASSCPRPEISTIAETAMSDNFVPAPSPFCTPTVHVKGERKQVVSSQHSHLFVYRPPHWPRADDPRAETQPNTSGSTLSYAERGSRTTQVSRPVERTRCRTRPGERASGACEQLVNQTHRKNSSRAFGENNL